MDVLQVFAVILILVIAALMVWVLASSASLRRDMARNAGQVEMISKGLESYRQANEGLKDTLSKTMQNGQDSVSKSLLSNLETIGDLKKQIGLLQGSNQQMLQLGGDIKRLQQILASPKMRGQIGEWSLENLLNNILPVGTFKLQHEFSDGKKVDALIKLPDYAVPIDAKFPLPGFEAMSEAENEDDKSRLRKIFLRDVAKHIDKIAELYIRPKEGTLDFAFMYIPAENVYYETIIKHKGDTMDVLEYSLGKKVIPVSPNVLYAYLMTVVMGLHGLQIEKQAAEIRQGLNSLKGRFVDFVNTWDVMGRHLRNTSSQYEEGKTKLDKFNAELENIAKTPEQA